MVSIRERPAEAEDRAIPGHWEGDLLAGANDTNIVTLVERHSRFTMLVKLARRDSATIVAALAQKIGTLPEELRRSLTWDQGKEMACHKSFTVATDLQVYFCDPRSPWQRGSNENTNGLLDSTSQEQQTSPRSRRPNSTMSLCGSTRDRENPWTSKRRPIGCRRCCSDRLNPPPHSGRSSTFWEFLKADSLLISRTPAFECKRADIARQAHADAPQL
ncbi:MAG: IS30 family transposase [Mesorhizobium sp.]|nr:MAG: IS30 family transposase [Mesorhizobium sp.]TKD47284.1 MAG: IS30 family transposase [Mesorhizobium sp.]